MGNGEMQIPHVYIVILNWNGKEDTLECLRSVQAVDYPRYQILVVDNASSDGSAEAIRAAFPGVALIVNESNLGFAAGNNVGIEHALEEGADYIFLLNNDTTVDRMVLVELVKTCEADPTVGLASPKVYYYDLPNTIFYAGARRYWLPLFPDPIGIGEEDRGQHDAVREVDYVWGQAMFIKRRVIEDIGLFDPGFFMYYEDCDYCLRAAEVGYKIIYVPLARIWHKIGAGTEGDLQARWRYRAQSMAYFHRKHSRFGPAQAALLTLCSTARILARELPKGKIGLAWRLARPYVQGLSWEAEAREQ